MIHPLKLAQLQKLLRYLALSEIALLPLIPSFPGYGYEQTKIISFIFLTTILGFLWWGGLNLYPKVFSFQIPMSLRLAGVFLVTICLSSLFGVDQTKSLLGAAPYFQGFFVYFYLFVFCMTLTNLKISFEDFSKAWLIGGGVVSLWAIKDLLFLEVFHQYVPTYSDRVVASFGQPNFYSGFLLLNLPLQIYLFKKDRFSRIWLLASLILSLLAILISHSRISIALSGVLVLGWGMLTLKSKLLRGYLLILGLVVVGFMGWRLYLDEISGPLDRYWLINNSPEKRIFIWQVIPEMVRRQPLLGYGLENIDQAYQLHFNQIDFNTNKNPLNLSLKDLVIDRTHNYLFDLLISTGALGLFCWIILVFFLILGLRKIKSKTLALCLLIYLIWIQFQNQSVIQLIYFWWLIAEINKQYLTDMTY